MSRKFKSLICLFIFLITLSPINVKATETKNIKDYLNYLSEPEVQQLQGSIDEIANKYNLDTVIVITDNTEGKTSMQMIFMIIIIMVLIPKNQVFYY